MKTIKALQSEVNRISKALDGIDTLAKLDEAKTMIGFEAMREIMIEALNYRYIADQKASAEAFLAAAR